MEAKGTITVDILAATADGGLVADVRETATQPLAPARAGRDHRRRRAELRPQAEPQHHRRKRTRCCAGSRAGSSLADDRSAGAAWNVDTSAGSARGAEHYRVVSADGTRLNLDYKAESKTRGHRRPAA